MVSLTIWNEISVMFFSWWMFFLYDSVNIDMITNKNGQLMNKKLISFIFEC